MFQITRKTTTIMNISKSLGTELFFLILLVSLTQAFYKIPPNLSGAVLETPSTIQELKNSLCNNEKGGRCFDTTLKIIKITKVFEFRGSEGTVTEKGCYHSTASGCKERGQTKLNISNQCNGLESVDVTYDKAGRTPLLVGSNKYIIGDVGYAAIIGKSLKVYNAHDVVIYGLYIMDINPRVIWGGDAISLDNATNVWIDGNYITRIGRQMLVTGFGGCQQITVSNNQFDGNTPYAPYCDGAHYWLWLFLGSNDTITLADNYIHGTAGRGPHSTGMHDAEVLVHMINNRFENISHAGLIESREITSRILVEGNSFKNVSQLISLNLGRMFFPKNESEAEICMKYFGRKCYINAIENSQKTDVTSDIKVLKELENYILTDVNTINRQRIQLSMQLLPIMMKAQFKLMFPQINLIWPEYNMAFPQPNFILTEFNSDLPRNDLTW